MLINFMLIKKECNAHELSTLWWMKKFLTSSMSLIRQHLITCFCLLLMTSFMPGDRHGPNTVCEHTIKTPPIRLWVSGQMNSSPDGDLGPKQLLYYGVERVGGGNDHEIADNDGPFFFHLLKKSLQMASFLHYNEKCFSSLIRKITE